MLLLAMLLSSTLAWRKDYKDHNEEKKSFRTILQHLRQHEKGM